MRITYEGPFDAVELADHPVVAARGETVDVPDELGARLLQQECWTEAKPGRTARKDAD